MTERQNQGFLEAIQTVQQVIEGWDVSDQAFDQMLNFSETRTIIERLTGLPLEGNPKARTLIRMWQWMYGADLYQGVKISIESTQRQNASDPTAERAIPSSKLTPLELALQRLKNGGLGDLSLETYRAALLSNISQGVRDDLPVYCNAAIVHKAITDNMDSLQIQQAVDTRRHRNVLSALNDLLQSQNLSQAANTPYRPLGHSKQQSALAAEDVSAFSRDMARMANQARYETESQSNAGHETHQLPLSQYRRADGSFDMEAAKKDYKNFLPSVPEKNRIYLAFVVERVQHVITDDSDVIFAYDGSMDEILYNPNNSKFYKYDFRIVETHELAHKTDKYFVRSPRQPDFVSAVQNSRAILDANPNFFIQYCSENDRDGSLSDVFSALCSGEYEFSLGHPPAYWTPDLQVMECFANIFTLEAIADTKKIQFLEEHFPDLIAAYRRLEFFV